MIVELKEDVSQSPYYNHDLAPVGREGRRWSAKDMAVLWISMAACIPTYQLASSLITLGMDWKQSIATILLGNLIVLIPMVLNAHAGTKYGIPFPVYCRSSFGILGANIPSILRALVACGWFGIQAWIGGQAIYTLLIRLVPSLTTSDIIAGFGINVWQLACFLFFWSLNMWVVVRGIESIRWLLNIKAPLLLALGTLFLYWAYRTADGFGPMLSQSSAFDEGGNQAGKFWAVFFPALTANVGFWATLSLNIPDFSRYAKSQYDQIVGQSLGLPTTMALFSFIGLAVTSATVVIFGAVEWDPVVILGKFENPMVLALAMISLCIATLATNIAANVVGPANDFAQLAPRRISFCLGGWITGVLGILIQPWRLVSDPSQFIFTWLIAYSALLGSVGGILIADYYIVRRRTLDLPALYRRHDQYWYWHGFNPVAIVALTLGILPCLPGFIATIDSSSSLPAFWKQLYNYAWFVSFAVSMISYLLLTYGAQGLLKDRPSNPAREDSLKAGHADAG
jgi:nucleobase:cation symporter-1, NCS1 family